MNFIPTDPNYQTKIRSAFERQGFMKLIGAELVEIAPGFVEIHLPYKNELSQQHGYFHAGVVGTIADNSGGFAAFTLLPSTSSILTVEFKLNLVAPGKGDRLIARGKVLKQGKTLTVCRPDVFSVKNGKEKLCATALMTLINLENTSDMAPGSTSS